MSKNLNILIISSRPPEFSAGLGQSLIDAFKSLGHKVDYLTRFCYPHQPENVISLTAEKISFKSKIKPALRKILKSLKLTKALKKIFKNLKRASAPAHPYANGISFVYENEALPEFSPQQVLEKISKPYDLVVTMFWQDMINSTTIKAICDKLKSPILIYSPDMAPMTGGCYYFNECRNFENGCGCCPALESSDPNDQSSINYNIKKSNYALSNSIFVGNTWTKKFADKSNLFKKTAAASIMIDPAIFKPEDKEKVAASLKLNIAPDDFIIMARSLDYWRKGNLDIAKAIKLFLDKIPDNEKKRVKLLTIGDDYLQSLQPTFGCEVINMGIVNLSKLVDCYNTADLFINASYDDAGPSMINQAMMCATPVVCYDSGTALDVIENGVSGFKTNVHNIDGLANGILSIYKLTPSQRQQLATSTRQLALQLNSPQQVAMRLIEIASLEESNALAAI